MTDSFPQFGRIENAAYQAVRIIAVVRSIRQGCGQVRRVPFDPEECAEKFGVRVRLVNLPNQIAGRLLRYPSGYEIEVCAADPRHRQRFTLSHELAHLCFLSHAPALPQERGIVSKVQKIDGREERLCNRIATELLMPQSRFLSESRQLNPSFESIEALSHIFDVSLAAVLARVKELAAWSVGETNWKLDIDTGVLTKTAKPRFWCRIRKKTSRSDRERLLVARLREAEMLLGKTGSAQLLNRIYSGGYVVVPVSDGEVTVKKQVDGSLQAFVLA
ncbi:MAG TPA: ImmA/IrrE family metallo-endopeptidase [Thermoanaerobaculia bacterium]|jgi:Zn-dependent peptidase ImmA (M78 family)